MNRNNIKAAVFLLLMLTGILSCKDDMMSEVTSLKVDRVFSPTDLDVRVVNRTGVRLAWKAVNNADSYTIELFEKADFSGTPLKTADHITFDQLPYTITGLDGETEYSVRVKAFGENISDSKWVSATFVTDAEQIFKEVDLAKILATSATLNWQAGEAVTTITLTPGNITHTITGPEITAGEVTITGLTGETAYTAKLMNGSKVRGTISFTTPIDLNGAIAVSPGDDLATLILNAQAGEVFALLPGTYNINANVTVSNSISIRGAKPADKPIVNGMVLKIKANAGLSLKDMVLDGTGAADNNQAIIYDEALSTPYGELKVQDCEIKNYVKGLMYVNVKALIEAVTYSGNIIHDIKGEGGDVIDFRNGMTNAFLFENNTMYNSGARDLFRMDAGGSGNFPGVNSVITIRTNTFNKVANAGRFLYIRLALNQIYFTKNLIANSNGYYTNQSATTITTLANNNYFNAPNFTASTTSNAKNDTGTFTLLDPGFTSPDTGNFTLANEDLKFNGIGDPRWR